MLGSSEINILDIRVLRDILDEMKKLRDHWCAEEVDDAEEMWTEIPPFLAMAVPAMEKALGDAYSIPPLEIISAKYGANGTYIDVTEKLKANGFKTFDSIEIKISNAIFGDPIFGYIKELIVQYKLGGEEGTIRAKENETLVIGGKS